MRLLTRILKRPEHVELGKYYRVVGTASSGIPLPPQIYIAQTVCRFPSGMGYFNGVMFVKIDVPGGKSYVLHYENHPMPFFDINVDGKGERFHDFHLEFKDSNEETVAWVMGDEAQKEIVNHMQQKGVTYTPIKNLWEKAIG